MQAGRYLLRARDLNPSDLEVRTKLGKAFLSVGEVAQARNEAVALVEASPADGEALMLLAETSRTEEELAAVEERFASFPEKESVYFHLASANVLLRRNDLARSEVALQKALTAKPDSPEAHSLMGAFFLMQKKVPEAVQELKIAAELSSKRPVERVRYAELLAQTGQPEEATRLLREISQEFPDYLPAWRSAAQIALAGKNYDQALTLLKNITARDAGNLDARTLEAEVWLAKGEPKTAIPILDAVRRDYSKLPSVTYQLARAHLQDKNTEQASVLLNEVVAANPNFAEASLQLAELNLRSGDAQSVISAMTGLLKTRPQLLQAQLLLVDAYRVSGNYEGASEILRQQIKAAPQNPQPQLLLGIVLRQQSKSDEARQAFEKALELAPENAAAAYQLVELDIQQKDFAAATKRLQLQLEKEPNSAGAHFLRGKVHASQREWDQAEAALQQALKLDPNFSGAYDLLVAVYLATNKLTQALEQLNTLLVKDPGNPNVLLQVALIHDKRGDFANARHAYEKLLAVKPDSTVAQNNLAYLYAERLNEPERAYALARKARVIQPESASIADTLGWILYTRGEYQEAAALLQESAAKLGDQPEVQFHLGMASYMMGNATVARKALQHAANSPAVFTGKEEAVRRLKLLSDESAGAKALSVEELEGLLKQQPNDLLARTRLAEAHESNGRFADAAKAYEETLKLNPKLVGPLAKLAQLYAGPLQDMAKAFDLAKKARDLAPNDPRIAGTLGIVAYRTGNSTWASSLLQESARQLPRDPEILHALAWTEYSLGTVEEARGTMQRLVDAAPESRQVADAKLFLAMTALGSEPERLTTALPEIETALAADPHYVPALMNRATIQNKGGDAKGAVQNYTAILTRYPDFAPAQKELARIYLGAAPNAPKAHELALKLRKTQPTDPEIARMLATAHYQVKQYAAALPLFLELARKQPLDAEGLFYVGMCHYHAKKMDAARESLSAALASGLGEPQASEAARVVAQSSRQSNSPR
jgi:tetratricopeptide (TPR) repeat protein